MLAPYGISWYTLEEGLRVHIIPSLFVVEQSSKDSCPSALTVALGICALPIPTDADNIDSFPIAPYYI